MKLFFRILCSTFMLVFICMVSYAQKSGNNEVILSAGFMKSQFVDEWDNMMIYEKSRFQPFNIRFGFYGEKWVHRVNFYYIENKLKTIEGEELFRFNYVNSKSGEIAYDILYPLIHQDQSKFFLYSGLGLHAFGSLRHRESLSNNYPHQTVVNSYDINAGSLQLVVSPEYVFSRYKIGTMISAGFLSKVTRPDSYNTINNSNHGKWPWVSFNKHFNFLWEVEYKRYLSDRFSIAFEYRMFYYSYSFPYPLKVLNQNYLIGLICKF